MTQQLPTPHSVQGLSIKSLAEQFGTPLYIYNSQVVAQSFSQLREVFGPDVDIFYSLKANPNVSVCALLKALGANAEVSSLTELKTAIKAGFAPHNIIFVGPYKTSSAIQFALEQQIYAIVCESREEFLEIAAIAKQQQTIANVAIRINPAYTLSQARLRMGGSASQFGIDQEDLFNHEKLFLNTPYINLLGIHVYTGTRILDADEIYRNTLNILELAEQVSQRWEKPFEMIDIGGGFGIPYHQDENAIDLPKLQLLLRPLIDKFKLQHPTTRLMLESGRYLMGTAGYFVSQIKVSKQSKGQHFLVTDGGTNCHMAAVGTNPYMKKNFPIHAITQQPSQHLQTCHITGPLCTPTDLLGKNISVPTTQPGDLIVVQASGAYGPTASPVLFLGHGYPSEIMIHQGKALLIRERDTPEDLLAKQRLVF